MSLPLPPNRLALFCKGFDPPGLTGVLAAAGIPEAAGTGHGQGWDWFTYEADRCGPDQLCGLAQQLPGWRHSELAAGIVGRDTSRYDADPGFNADGRHTLALLAAHYGLPSPPLSGLAGNSSSP
ncbi:hypothetical protein ACWEJ7_10650 [Streptomyces albidoflavus]